MRNTNKLMILIIILFFQWLNGFSHEGQDNGKTQEDTVAVSKTDFLIYQVETMYQLITLQSSIINNINLTLQLMNEENRRMRNDIDSLYKALETLDINKIKGKPDRKRKTEPVKL